MSFERGRERERGPNLSRLRELKTKWDPDNFFHKNVNILPR